jgi:hypothetical protein
VSRGAEKEKGEEGGEMQAQRGRLPWVCAIFYSFFASSKWGSVKKQGKKPY